MTDKLYLGVDLGTSALKLLFLSSSHQKTVIRVPYLSKGPDRFYEALKAAFSKLDGKDNVASICFAGQVGTYLIDGEKEIAWDAPDGEKELDEILSKVPQERFAEEIGMPHPRLVSYPLPRLLAIASRYPDAKKVGQPKDYLLETLTGRFVSDPFSWRGLAKGTSYATELLKEFGLSFRLPDLRPCSADVGPLTEKAKADFGISGDPEIINGCNDFYAGLLGMGEIDGGTYFDVGGTSEHFGLLTDGLSFDGTLVSGPYFERNATYGGTTSSGYAIELGRSYLKGEAIDLHEECRRDPPYCVPFFHGARSPYSAPRAHGGFEGGTDKEGRDMAYAAYEGVAFSLYDIARHLPKEKEMTRVIVSGGMGQDSVLNTIKASLFGVPVVPVMEKDATALGAALLGESAATGLPYQDLQRTEVALGPPARPDEAIRKRLLERFPHYLEIIPAYLGQRRK